ncbi:lipopolysaccharide biosynthesis protein [Cereibacter johrii]|uniref:lipopolysaccharide biosynthesis protein n=1 Tax=Cereibacter johrii TaxID=445629 RepID=UPI002B207EF9|nr:lipopolysaccharide biosynthesis protein [Cereibacter johrii]
MTAKRHSNRAGNLSYFLRYGAVVGVIKLASIPLVLSISVLLARWLGPEEYGVYAISWSLATIGAVAVSGGVSQYLTRRVAMLNTKNRHPEVRPAITASMQFVTLAALLFLLVLAIGWMLDATSLKLSGQTIVLVFLSATFIGVVNIGSAGLRGLERASEGQLYLLIMAPLTSILLLILLMQIPVPRTSWAALAVMAAGYGLAASLSQLRLRRLTKGFGRSGPAHTLVPALAVQSKGYIAYSTLMIVGLQLNLIMVGFLLQEEDVSYYNLADKAAQFVWLPVGIFELLMATRVARLHSEGNFGAIQKLYRSLSLAGGAAALLVAGLLYALGEHIISLLLGPFYAGNIYPVLLLLLVAQLIRAAFGPVTVTLLMTGRQNYCVASQLTGIAAIAAATWLLVPSYGLHGAGMAACIGMLAASLPLAIGGYRTLGLRPLFL